ncbi:cell division protein ZipA [Gayadomonas joobiniege]|uniref:cell division protein ZipA n=1 Tax=Gayadomonas joobiniege TaxID=1234606 RepID=UPI000367BCB1|nr:cell division protein ZipA [Gayadomonas joobiniege]
MESELRAVLMVLGVLALLALVVHGVYTIRQNKKLQSQQLHDQEADDEQSEEPDDAVISKPRVVGDSIVEKSAETKASLSEKLTKIKTPKSAVKAPKERVEPGFGEQQNINLVTEDDSQIQTDLGFSAADNEENLPEDITPATSTDNQQQQNSSDREPEEVLILNVVPAEGQSIQGARLLPKVLELGFKFGDFNIFHRYQDAKGEGSVLFSLANMYNPGTFDIDNMEQFNTQGLSLFMSLPVDAEALATFKKMHEAAKEIAAEFNGQVLDGQRSVLTRQTVQHYHERIREFERRRLLK